MIPGAAGGGEGEGGFLECENSSVPRSGSGFGIDEAVEEEQEDIPVLPNVVKFASAPAATSSRKRVWTVE